MSEIRVTTLKDTSGGNSSSTADIYSGRAKAWVNFNGASTVAIRANFNVNSITDNGTGKYTVNFSSSLSDANYSFQMHCIDTAGTDRTVIAGGSVDGTSPTASALNFNTFASYNASLTDPAQVTATIFR